jgi:DNA-binding XRE family transcriptional regulator
MGRDMGGSIRLYARCRYPWFVVLGLKKRHAAPQVRESVSMVNKPARAANGPIPTRLREIRRAEHIATAKEFAELLGASSARYGNIESGSYKLSISVAHAVVDAVPGMTLDWLYCGREAGLAPPLRDRLLAAREEMASEARRLSR